MFVIRWELNKSSQIVASIIKGWIDLLIDKISLLVTKKIEVN